jgi:hypothetical protein
MAEKWYLFKGGRQIGPLNFNELEQMASAKEFVATDLVISDQMKEWVKADTVSGLFSAMVYAPPSVSMPINITNPPPRSAFPSVSSTVAAPPSQFAPPPPPAAGSKSFIAPPPPVGGTVSSASSFQPNIGSKTAPNIGNQRMAVKPGRQKWKIPIIIGSVVIFLLLAIAVIASLADEPTPMTDTAQMGTPPSSDNVPVGSGVESEQTLPTVWQGLKEFNEPGFGFAINYPASWSATVEDEAGVIYFQGAEGSDDFYNLVIVVILSRFQHEGAYSTFDNVKNTFEELISSENGEIYYTEKVSLDLGNSTHDALLMLAYYDSIEGRSEDTILIVERDSNYFYQISYSAPAEVSIKYNDLVLENILNSFRFTDF